MDSGAIVISRRAAILACLSLPLAKFDILAQTKHKAATSGGVLTVPLDDYAGIIVKYRGKVVAITNTEIFAAVTGEDT